MVTMKQVTATQKLKRKQPIPSMNKIVKLRALKRKDLSLANSMKILKTRHPNAVLKIQRMELRRWKTMLKTRSLNPLLLPIIKGNLLLEMLKIRSLKALKRRYPNPVLLKNLKKRFLKVLEILQSWFLEEKA